MSLTKPSSTAAEDLLPAGPSSRATKSAAAFRTISEVASELDVPAHVLRFWESKFPQIKPLKRGGGRRYYRPEDVDLLRRIRLLLYRDGYTIKGAQKLLRAPGQRDFELEPDDMEATAAPVQATPRPAPVARVASPDTVAVPLFAPRQKEASSSVDEPTRRAIEQMIAELADIRDMLRGLA